MNKSQLLEQQRHAMAHFIRNLETEIDQLNQQHNYMDTQDVIALKERELTDAKAHLAKIEQQLAAEDLGGYMRPCETCNGTGGTNRGDDVRICPDCNGTGIYTGEDTTNE